MRVAGRKWLKNRVKSLRFYFTYKGKAAHLKLGVHLQQHEQEVY